MLLAGEGKASDEVDCALDKTAASVRTYINTTADTDIDIDTAPELRQHLSPS